jgi:hypothetical protein
MDPREADRIGWLGALAGLDFGRSRRLFAEVRYERWFQTGVKHHELPAGLGAVLFGLRLR